MEAVLAPDFCCTAFKGFRREKENKDTQIMSVYSQWNSLLLSVFTYII